MRSIERLRLSGVSIETVEVFLGHQYSITPSVQP
jgi:hypothetical protein